MRFLIDTVVFIWAVNSPERISRKAMAVLKNDKAVCEISAISVTEIAIKHSLGKLIFHRDDVILGIEGLRLLVLPYTVNHALQLFALPKHHKDPFDCQIISQAMVENIPIVTADEKFRLYKGVRIIW